MSRLDVCYTEVTATSDCFYRILYLELMETIPFIVNLLSIVFDSGEQRSFSDDVDHIQSRGDVAANRPTCQRKRQMQ